MAPIPTSKLIGHQALHDRVGLALGRCQEESYVEFKSSAPWNALCWKITKTSMAMANLRDGGFIVIGVAEKGSVWDLSGIAASDLSTYDPDNIMDFVNKYASPDIQLDIVTFDQAGGLNFLCIGVKEFVSTPVVCKRNGEENLQEGAVYVRASGKPRTTKVVHAGQMHDLLDLAAEKRARELLATSRRVGMVAPATAHNQFDEELGGL